MKTLSPVIILLATTLLPGCSYIKSWFPDKEKDYQYTVEIPELVLPDTLTAPLSPITPNPADMRPATPEQMPNAAPPTAPQASAQPIITPAEVSPAAPAETPTHTTANFEKTTTQEPILRLNVRFDAAWRALDKALSRHSFEVTQCNKAEKNLIIHYDPNEKKLEDGSFWDELSFIFQGFNSNEHTYILQLSETLEHTQIQVLNEQKQAVTDDNAVHLLHQLQHSIASDTP